MELMTANIVLHFAVGVDIRGLEGMKQYCKSSKASFPDWHDDIENLIAEGNTAVAKCSEIAALEPGIGYCFPAQRDLVVKHLATS